MDKKQIGGERGDMGEKRLFCVARLVGEGGGGR
jgi:hypothetical protein